MFVDGFAPGLLALFVRITLSMHAILYISDYTGKEAELDTVLLDICARAKKKNPDHGITGVLFYHRGNFLQLIEGERDELESLMTIVGKDTRHCNITRLIDEAIEERGFADWNMDTFNLDKEDAINRPEVAKVKEMIDKCITMDTSIFIKTLKAIYQRGNLDSIL